MITKLNRIAPKVSHVSWKKQRLYSDTTTIGTRNRWAELLESKGLRLRGHRLIRLAADRQSSR